jgi:hypothetical protein
VDSKVVVEQANEARASAKSVPRNRFRMVCIFFMLLSLIPPARMPVSETVPEMIRRSPVKVFRGGWAGIRRRFGRRGPQVAPSIV